MLCFWKYVQKCEGYGRLKSGKSTCPGSVCVIHNALLSSSCGSSKQSKLSTRKRTSIGPALQAKNKQLLSCCSQNTTYRAFGWLSLAFEELLHCLFLRSAPQRGDLWNDRFIVIIGPVVAEIWSFEAVRHIQMSTLASFMIFPHWKGNKQDTSTPAFAPKTCEEGNYTTGPSSKDGPVRSSPTNSQKNFSG